MGPKFRQVIEIWLFDLTVVWFVFGFFCTMQCDWCGRWRRGRKCICRSTSKFWKLLNVFIKCHSVLAKRDSFLFVYVVPSKNALGLMSQSFAKQTNQTVNQWACSMFCTLPLKAKLHIDGFTYLQPVWRLSASIIIRNICMFSMFYGILLMMRRTMRPHEAYAFGLFTSPCSTTVLPCDSSWTTLSKLAVHLHPCTLPLRSSI